MDLSELTIPLAVRRRTDAVYLTPIEALRCMIVGDLIKHRGCLPGELRYKVESYASSIELQRLISELECKGYLVQVRPSQYLVDKFFWFYRKIEPPKYLYLF